MLRQGLRSALAHSDDHEVLGLVAQVIQRTVVVHMFDEAGHTHERLPPHRRGAHRLAVGEELARVRAKQDAVGGVQREEGADRQFIRCELCIERSIAIQLALGGQLRDLAADTALGAHGTAVERLQRMAVARTGHEATAETARTLPALCRRAAQTKADPAQLRAGETERGIALQCRGRAPRGRPQLEGIGADRSRVFQQLLQQCLSFACRQIRRPAYAQVTRCLCRGERGTRTHRALVYLRCTQLGILEAPPQPLQQALRTVRGWRCDDPRGRQQQGCNQPPAAHAQPWSVTAGAGAGSGAAAGDGDGLPAAAGRYCCRRWKKRR